MMLEQLHTSIPHASKDISITSNDHKLLDHFFHQLFPYVCWGPGSDFECVHDAIKVIKDQHGYIVTYKESCFAADTEKTVVRYVSRKILWSILIESPYTALHCAVLSNTSNNFLFAGPSGTGKSTLSAFLCRNGFTYYTDDKVIVNCLDGMIVPFAKPIYLREGGRIVLETAYNIEIPEKCMEFGGEKRYWLDWQSAQLPEHKKIRIIFIEHSPTGNALLKKISEQDAFVRLAENLIFANPLSQKTKLILQLIANTECFLLCYKSLYDALDLLNNI